MDEPSVHPVPRPGFFVPANLWNAVPAFLIALAYAVAGLGGVPILGFDGEMLSGFLLVEFLAVFFGIFLLALIFALRREKEREMRIRIAVMLGFTFSVALGLSFTVGPWGPLFFILATLGTYWSPWKRWYNDRGIGNSSARGLVVFVLYFFWVFLPFLIKGGGIHPWTDVPMTHGSGLLYFLSLGILEWSGGLEGGRDA